MLHQTKRFVVSFRLRMPLFGTALLALTLLSGLVSPLAAAVSPDPHITEYPAASGSAPFGAAAGADGNVWFTENTSQGSTNKIGKITPSGTVTEYDIPTGGAGARGITKGPDGNMWFTEGSKNKIGKITPSGTITEYSIPTLNSSPRGIVAGPDGNLWFAETGAGQIGKITPSGVITEYSDPSLSCPWGITNGPDGDLWFTDECEQQVGKITTNGTFTFYPVPGSNTRSITTGPDGNLWIGEWDAMKIDKMSTDGTILATYNTPVYAYTITPGSDGHLWFADPYDEGLADITVDGTVTSHVFPTTNAGPYGITTGPDGNIWFTEYWVGQIGKYTFATSSIENAAPNGGDANNDGIPDSMQPNVTSFVDPVSGKYTSLATSGCVNNASATVTPESHNAVSDGTYNYPDGMMNFTLNCAAGTTATVHMYFYGLTYSSGMVLRKYDSSAKKYATVSGAVLKGVTIGGDVATEVTYTIKDGGPLDQDGSANGVIVDPAGVASTTVSAPDTGNGSPRSIIPLVALTFTAAITAAAAFIVRPRSVNTSKLR